MTAHRRIRAPEVLHLDVDLLVVDKPPSAPMTAGAKDSVGLVDLIRERVELPAEARLRTVSRVHDQTSGVVVFARSAASQRDLIRQFAEGRAETTYLALVSGYVDDDGEIDIPLRYDKRAGKLLASGRHGKPALTRYRIVERVAGNTLLECRPVSERTDQLRTHLAAIGHPLTVDAALGGGHSVLLSAYKSNYRSSARHPERPLIERLSLHAATVSLHHPGTGEPVQFTAPMPKDLRATLTQLGRLC